MESPQPDSRHTPADPLPLTESAVSLLAQLVDELTASVQRGGNPDVQALAGQYPALADELRSLWATVWVAEILARDDSAERSSGNRREMGSRALVTAEWPMPTEDLEGGWRSNL